MPIFRPTKNKASKTHSVTLSSLLALCKSKEEQDNLINAIADMEIQGEATLTMDSRLRTLSYKAALEKAGLSQETIDSILEQGDSSGLIGSKESQLAESYLAENLASGKYVSRDDVDKVVKQLQDNLNGGVDFQTAKTQFENSMQKLCDNAQKFTPKEIVNEQIARGKEGETYDIYRKDNKNGICVTEVPKAIISANKDKVVADLREQVQKNHSFSRQNLHSIKSDAKGFNGDPEQMTKATLQMTAHAMMAIISLLIELAKREQLKRALKEGEVDIQDVVNNLVSLEKDQMEEKMHETFDEDDFDFGDFGDL